MDAFTEVWALWLLLGVAVMAAMYALSVRRIVLNRARFAERALHGRLGLGGRDLRRVIGATLCLLAAVTAVLSIARPTGSTAEEERSMGGMDVIVVMDLSLSMLARDGDGQRVARSKEVVRELVAKSPSNRYGLVTFSGEAIIVCPLTHDHGAFLTMLDSEGVTRANAPGSAMGDGIVAAFGRFEKEEDVPRAVLVVSDGENTYGIDPVEAAAGAKAAGLKVYTLGVGSQEGARIPVRRDILGNLTYKYDRRGKMVISRLDEEMLKRVAEAGDGRYFHATDRNVSDALKVALSERSMKAVETGMKRSREFGPVLSFAAAGLLIMALLV